MTFPQSLTSIGYYAFSRCSSLTSVTFPQSLTSIGEDAFGACSGLMSLTFPESLTSIEGGAFDGCTGLTSVTIADSDKVLELGQNLFCYAGIETLYLGRNFSYYRSYNRCNSPFYAQLSLKNLTISDKVTDLPNYAFESCTGLTSLTFPESLTSIGESAFDGCTGLTSLTFPESLTSIGDGAFYGCTGLTSVKLPGSLTSIGKAAFSDCTGLTSVTIADSDNVLKFGFWAFDGANLETLYLGRNISYDTSSSGKYGPFYNRTSLKDVVISGKATSLPDWAFYGCTGLTSVTIADAISPLELGSQVFGSSGAESLYLGRNITYASTDGDGPFQSFSNLAELTLSDNVTAIGDSFFRDCSSLSTVSIPESVATIGESAFRGCTRLTSVAFPTTLLSIGSSAFRECSHLPSIEIPASVSTIGENAFCGCDGMTSVTIADAISPLELGSQVFGSSGVECLHLGRNITYISTDGDGPFQSLSDLAELTLSDNVTAIGDSFFRDCSSLSAVSIPESVATIGESAFRGCTGLTSVAFPTTLLSIGSSAFRECAQLQSIEIPASVSTIGADAFYGCDGLTSVTIADAISPLALGSQVFGSSGVEWLHLGRNITYISTDGDGPFQSLSNLAELTLSDNVTAIGDSFFRDCSSLSAVSIPESAVTIGESAFRGCTGLTSVAFPTKLLSIGSSAFRECAHLPSIEIPASVSTIGENAFYRCSDLQEVILADSESTLDFGSDVFGQSALQTLYLGRKISHENSTYGPFYGKSSIKALTISDCVDTIGESEFRDCDGLVSLEFPSSVKTIGDYAFYDCDGLAAIEIPASVSVIGERAFGYCSNLCDVNLADGDNVLDSGAEPFYNSGVRNLYLGRNVTYLTEGMSTPFHNQTNLMKVTIGNTVSDIADSFFLGCRGLSVIEIPNTVRKIGSSAFEGCTGLSEVYVGNGVNSIGESAFKDCQMIDRAEFASYESLCGIDFANNMANPLYYAHSLYVNGQEVRDLVIPDEVPAIGNYAFAGCTAYNTMTIGSNVSTIGTGAFEGMDFEDIQSLAQMAPSIDDTSFSEYSKRYCTVGVSQEALASYKEKWSAFTYFAGVIEADNTITVSTPGNLINQLDIDRMPEMTALKLIGRINGTDLLAINKCRKLVTLDLSEATIVNGGMPYYEKDNERFGTEDNTLGQMWSYNLDALTWVKVPDNLITIGKAAFDGKTNILEISIPETVTTIGESAFNGCVNLKSVEIGDNVASIGAYAFNGCISLKDVRMGDNVTSIGAYAFNRCGELSEIRIPAATLSIGKEAFRDCVELRKMTFDNGDDRLTFGTDVLRNVNLEILSLGRNISYPSGSYSSPFYNMSSISTLTIGNPINEVRTSDLRGCTGVKHLVLQDGRTTLTFEEKVLTSTKIEDVYLGRNLLMKSYDPFYNDELLETLTIGPYVKWIDTYAFYGCSGLTSVVIPNSVTSIGKYAFYGCSELKSVRVSNSITEISESVFENCRKLQRVNVPDPVRKIGKAAFKGCVDLTDIVLPGSLKEISAEAFNGCSNLTAVKVINPIPPVIESNTFSSRAAATLSVPVGSRNIYWIHPYWGEFATINTWGGDEESSFTEKNVSYQVTSEIDQTVEVTAASLVSRIPDIIIPSEVEFQGKQYRVAGIANNGFENVPAASVSLPASIGYVGLEAFKGCGALRTVECKATVPPSVYYNSFDEEAYTTATLEVPEEAVADYRKDAVWGKFNIGNLPVYVTRIELDPSEWYGEEGETFQITATVYPATAADKEIEWSSSDEEYAVVSQEGVVTILKSGDCDIIARATDGSGVKAVCKLRITSSVDGVDAEQNAEMEVYNMSGILVLRTDDREQLRHLDKGIYIVRTGSSVRKIAVN